ncbi:MAG TPA: adenylate/guanylate cyclase domain-containing protein [Gemmatimonadaceae bacterium]|jgi:adenylate cyclase|nr:adenylate/guanylate cyclase domain-containing protein [Gemmatimonadaceae bacterium]
MSFRLISPDGDQVFELRHGASLTVGRALTSDVALLDPTVSRRHASLVVDDSGIELNDLGSSNGTFVNGQRVEHARLGAGDVLMFGKLSFNVSVSDAADNGTDTHGARHAPTILRQRAVPDAEQAFAEALRASGSQPVLDETAIVLPDEERVRQKLALLLEVSKALTRAFDADALLEKIAGIVFQILDVDRFSILLLDDHGDLVPSIARDRTGVKLGRTVPLSIARKAIEEKVAILSDNAPEDVRFTGQSIVHQQVRSAVCAPLVGSENRAIGVLYVDSLTSAHRFTEDDLDFVVAFSGIVAVAIENSRFAERIRKEVLARSNFERFFSPGMAARIADATGGIQLGGDRRTVAVLFADIRNFTPLSATMDPDETARLLTEFFTEMVECVFKHGGTLDKFIGDALMAQWGAPISEPDDADRALDASVDMMHSLDQLNARWASAGRPQLKIGIGLNYGEAFAGNIGSERRLEFTVIGDTVNTASRICAWAEGGEILLSQAFRDALTRTHPLVERPPLRLRGKTEPVTVYRALA